MRIIKIISITVLALLLLFILLILSDKFLTWIPFGIKLPFGWEGRCYGYEYFGFPFSVLSNPPPGTLCVLSFNILGYVLNYLFLVVLACFSYLSLSRIFGKKLDVFKRLSIIVLIGGITVAGFYIADLFSKSRENEWKTYKNEEYGYEFKYPRAWTLDAKNASNVEFWSPTTSALKERPREVWPDLRVVIKDNPNKLEFEDWFRKQLIGEEMLPQILSTKKLVELKNGLVGYSIQELGIADCCLNTYIPTGSRFIDFVVNDDPASQVILEKVLGSFKLDWRLYKNKTYRYEIQYPQEFAVRENTEADTSFYHTSEPMNPFVIVASKYDPSSPLEDNIRKIDGFAPALNTMRKITIDGIPGYRAEKRFGGDSTMTEIFLNIQDRIYRITYDDSNPNVKNFEEFYEIFTKMVSSLKIEK